MHLRIGLFVLIVCMLFSTSALSHNYTSLPLLVNIHAFPEMGDEANEAEFDFLKERFELNVKDVNRMLDKASNKLGKDSRLRLGPIKFQRNTSGTQEVQQGSQGARDLVKAGQKELRDKQEDKGIKVYIVDKVKSTGGMEIPGLGDQGTAENPGRVTFFPENTFGVQRGLDGFEGSAGPFLLHEIGHNAGMAENHEAEDNGIHFMKGSLANKTDDRTISEAQLGELDKLFKKYGKTEPNDEQQGAFLPPPNNSNIGFKTDPVAGMNRPLDWVSLILDDNQLFSADIAWGELWNLELPLAYSISIGLDYDDMIETSLFPAYGDGIDVLFEISVEHSPGFDPFVSGSVSYHDPSLQNAALDSIELFMLGLSGADGDFDPDRNAIQLRHDMSIFPSPANQIPVIVNVDEDLSPFSFTTIISRVPEAFFTSLPVTVRSIDTVTVEGEGFSANSPVDLFFELSNSANATPMVSGVSNGAGEISLPLTVDTDISGDYFVSVVDANGIIGTGVITVIANRVYRDGFEL